jgi:hypothetical protein
MKNIALLSTFCFLLLSLVVKAQTPPNAFNYSAVARNAAGQPIANATIGIQISILKTSPTGASQYSENHFVNTDAFGLFNLVIGLGAVQSGSMANIDWSNDNYYLKLGMDATGGTNFLTMGTTLFLSVPFALYAKTAESIVGSGYGFGSFTHFIGEEFGGGVIFHLWKDSAGIEHGLIVDKVNLSSSHVWSNIDTNLIGPAAQSAWNGLSNSNAIVGQAGHAISAAALCLNSNNGGQSDWYLPSIDELKRLYDKRLEVNTTLRGISGAVELVKNERFAFYLSSTEISFNYAYYFEISMGYERNINKSFANYVRAVRAF